MAKQTFWDRNKTWLIPVGIVVVLLLFLVMWFVGAYNSLIVTREGVDKAWGDVEAQYQRRADLIPNLVETVKGITEQEQTVFTEVTEARSRVGQITITADELSDPAAVRAFQSAQADLGSAIARLLAVAENYPQLRSSENFLALQDQLEGTENRIATARRDYNDAVRSYNIRVQRVPTALVASMFGFDTRVFYEADEGTDAAPDVAFA